MQPHLTPKDIERFWEKVDRRGPDECWNWQASFVTGGYGFFKLDGRTCAAHRVSYLITHGVWNTGGHFTQICHTCDNPACVNPAHLYNGSAQENANDKIERGRMRGAFGFDREPLTLPGESNPRAKLTEHDVRAILACADSEKTLSQRYGVSRWAIHNIRHGKSWRHIPR